MRAVVAFVALVSAIVGVRMCRVIVAVSTILMAVRSKRLMTVAVMASAIMMMTGGHALARHDRGYPLYRDGERQQQGGE
jgi:hypothetical protein